MSTLASPVLSVSVPFGSIHAAMGVVGSLSARTRHLDDPDAVTARRRHNLVAFTGTRDALIAHMDRLRSRGLLSGFAYETAMAHLSVPA